MPIFLVGNAYFLYLVSHWTNIDIIVVVIITIIIIIINIIIIITINLLRSYLIKGLAVPVVTIKYLTISTNLLKHLNRKKSK
jgi:hypothetical protein